MKFPAGAELGKNEKCSKLPKMARKLDKNVVVNFVPIVGPNFLASNDKNKKSSKLPINGDKIAQKVLGNIVPPSPVAVGVRNLANNGKNEKCSYKWQDNLTKKF